jgi:hypothetical protein
MLEGIRRGAVVSECGRYRWTMTRDWDERPRLLVGMFNPSDANHEIDDPTAIILCHIAAHNGFGGYTAVNLTPLRSSTTGPAIDMLRRAQVDGDLELREVLWRNARVIDDELAKAGAFLAAWGAMGAEAGSWYELLMQTLRDRRTPVYRLGVCANGHPKHPMARGKHKVPKDAPLLRWEIGG